MKTIIPFIILVLINQGAAYCQLRSAKNTEKAARVSLSRVTVRVLDKETFQPVDASILVVNQNPDNPIDPIFENPSYTYKIPLNNTAQFTIEAPGYITLKESVLTSEMNATEVFYLTPQSDKNEVRGQSTRSMLNNEISTVLYFSQSNTTMSTRSGQVLENLLAFIAKHEVTRIELHGHTDDIGDPEKNMLLSMQRADLIRQQLVANHIAPAQIKSKAYGCTRPAAPNDTERNRRFNRRVEIRLALAD